VTHAFITVAIPFASKAVPGVNKRLIDLGNPARVDITDALNESSFVHFMSITVAHKEGESKAHLVLEASADGNAPAACARLAQTIGTPIVKVLQAAGLKVPRNLGAYLEVHRLDAGAGWFSTSGVVFSGTPGMSVRRIKEEEHLAAWIGAWLERNRKPEPALQKLERVRDEIFEMAELKWAFVAEPVPLLGEQPLPSAAVRPVVVSLLRVLLWPLLIPPVLVAIVSRQLLGRSGPQAIWDAVLAFGLEMLFAGIGLGIAYLWLRRHEESDAHTDEEPNATAVEEIMARENIVVQNHLAGASFLKPGFVRRMILRLVFWAVGAATTYVGRPGFLNDIGTIHFARWLILPRTDTMLFLSNYDGSWESYLEDFIARAHVGLSAIWSNTRDFPKTRNLIEEGASDGERFKRWARRHQGPTHFWFSAYPNLSAARIRTNAAIRHGFASTMTEEAAAQWLHYQGFPTPSASRLDSEQIPSLVFGGLSPLRHAHCLILELAGQPKDCRGWLGEVAGELSYGDGVPTNSAVVVGFSVSGLRKFGVEEPALATFPVAFQQGMAASWRARALGDTGTHSPETWLWGGPRKEGDVIILLYAKDAAMLDQELKHRIDQIEKYGHRWIHRIAMAVLPEKGGEPVREPFGFIDGISQPIIRGTRRWAAEHSQNQVIAPGEIILGYPDNLGYCPPMPDSNGFPLGRNGTFLVARQLEQDPDRFCHYLDEASEVIAADPRSPGNKPAWVREWIAAKMVGRWREDGTSLVRHPTPPGTPDRITVAEDNDFLFGAEDPDGLRCPFGAHIRRANPRDSFDPGSQVQIGITNRHRILRVGRKYGAADNGCNKPGLLFMCLNSDIEGQFEFLQQTWVLGRNFSGLDNETDALVGHHQDACEKPMSIPTPFGAMRVPRMQDFVTVRGGAYFFMPGKRAVDFLTQ
jgi:deferrochelatase/peroxidase EfeB